MLVEQYAVVGRAAESRLDRSINQLGGRPEFNPEGLAIRSASQYAEGESLLDMIPENLIAEWIAMEGSRN